MDRLIDYGGRLADLSAETIEQLDKILPAAWSKGNPVDIIGDAEPERYAAALQAVLEDKNADAILVINCPTALASSADAAEAIIRIIKNNAEKPALTAWLGGETSEKSREILARNNIPSYATPEDAVRGFSYLTGYARLREELMRPLSSPSNSGANPAEVRKIIQSALQTKRYLLTEAEAKAVLAACGIPVTPMLKAKTPEEVFARAGEILKNSREVVVKIVSETITHKLDVGGVALNLSSPEAAQEASQAMIERLGDKIDGFTIQPMINRLGAHELILGLSRDQTFGPIIMFGAGGTGVQVIDDKAVALPPLDTKLAHDLIERTRIFKLLKGYRNRPPADLDAIATVLSRLSQMAIDFPEINELDINPVVADENGVLALDARIVIKGTTQGRP